MPRRNGRHEYAVIGLGRFGTSVAMTLVEAGHYVLGIDRDREIVQRLADDLTRTVALDSTDTDSLHAVDITSFETVIVAIGTNFEASLLTTVELKAMGVRNVVCKATSERQRTILLRVGADRVVLPEHDAGRRLARELTEPTIIDRLDIGPDFNIVELAVPDWLVGRTLQQAELRRKYRISVLAVKRDAQMIVMPPVDFVFQAGDLVFVLGSTSDTQHFCGLA